MRILILCDFFEPVRMIGAVRPTDFARCFLEMGHSVDVVTLWSEKWPHDNNESTDIKVQRIDVSRSKYFRTYNFFCKARNLKKNKNNANSYVQTDGKEKKNFSLMSYLRAFYSTKMSILFGKSGKRALYSTIKNNINGYDVIYSTYGGFSSILCGELIKKKNKKIRWIADFRDAVYYEMFTKANKKYYRNFVKDHCKLSDALVFASSGYLKDTILPKDFHGKIDVIENGFMEYRNQRTVPNKKLLFLYSGSMYGDRHLYSFFNAIKQLECEYKTLDILINFCGDNDSYNAFLNEAKQYNVEKYVAYCGFLSSKPLYELELLTDIFLISSWNYSNYTGVLPGKLFEYFSFKKPIVGHVSGKEPNSLLKSIINNHSLGFCADEIDEHDYDFVVKTIHEYYEEFKKTGFVSFRGVDKYLNQFLRRNQAKRLINLVQ